MLGGGLGAVVWRMNIRNRTGHDDAVEMIEEGIEVHRFGQGRDHHRERTRHFSNRAGIFVAERMKDELGRPLRVVATGGLATLFDKHTKIFDVIEPDLTIQGLSLLYDMAARASR